MASKPRSRPLPPGIPSAPLWDASSFDTPREPRQVIWLRRLFLVALTGTGVGLLLRALGVL